MGDRDRTNARRLRALLRAGALRNVLAIAILVTPLAASHSCAGDSRFDSFAPRHLTDLIVDCKGHARDGVGFTVGSGRVQHVCRRGGAG